jgi:hypothetical protein
MPIWSPSSGQTEFSTTTVSTLTAPATVINTVAGTVPLTLTGASGQSVDLLDIGAFGGAAGGLVAISAAGQIVVPNGNGFLGATALNAQIIVAANAATPWGDVALNDMVLKANGTTKSVRIGSQGTTNSSLIVTSVTNGVNSVQVTNAATGTSPIIAATGTDAAVGLTIQTRNASAPVNAISISAAGNVTFLNTATFTGNIANFSYIQTANIEDAGGASVVIKLATNALAFYGVAPVARAAAITAVVTTGAALASYGFTQAQADSIPTRINAIITALQNIGITL